MSGLQLRCGHVDVRGGLCDSRSQLLAVFQQLLPTYGLVFI